MFQETIIYWRKALFFHERSPWSYGRKGSHESTAAAFRLPSQTTAALQLPSTSWWPKKKLPKAKGPPPNRFPLRCLPANGERRWKQKPWARRDDEEIKMKMAGKSTIFSWRYAGDTSSNALCCHLFNEESELDVGNARRVVPSQVTRVKSCKWMGLIDVVYLFQGNLVELDAPFLKTSSQTHTRHAGDGMTL